jgi:hypothetical protein
MQIKYSKENHFFNTGEFLLFMSCILFYSIFLTLLINEEHFEENIKYIYVLKMILYVMYSFRPNVESLFFKSIKTKLFCLKIHFTTYNRFKASDQN